MDNFEVLNQYSIPSDVLKNMLSLYKLIGMNNQYEEKLAEKKTFLEK